MEVAVSPMASISHHHHHSFIFFCLPSDKKKFSISAYYICCHPAWTDSTQSVLRNAICRNDVCVWNSEEICPFDNSTDIYEFTHIYTIIRKCIFTKIWHFFPMKFPKNKEMRIRIHMYVCTINSHGYNIYINSSLFISILGNHIWLIP